MPDTLIARLESAGEGSRELDAPGRFIGTDCQACGAKWPYCNWQSIVRERPCRTIYEALKALEASPTPTSGRGT